MSEERVMQSLFLPTTRAECIRILRLRLGYTQGKIADDLGLSREQVSKMETQFLNVSDKLWNYVLQHAYSNLYLDKEVSLVDFDSALCRLIKS